ncbi:uncharacterized protein LOC143299684 isoform X3 [Babylonia areolata]|uniref:uncharacterized protein LOC143299684 isoform X3 n=1 Tax=Babylonia areolata TaxID=304850 RepID=UPI003FD3B7C6
MDDDSSTKFMESLTKFLQSLCNGYVEFQRGVELVGHIYLNIDTGEKVDYILHEKVSKNDENSVTFVSNSFHALPKEKDKKPAASGSTPKAKVSSDDDDDDIFIVDQSDSVLGSTNSGTIPSRGVKRTAPTSSDQRRVGAPLHHSFSRGSNQQSSQWKSRQQPGSASSQSISQENLSIGEVKLEQISSDELLSLASQVSDGASSSQVQGRPVGRSDHGSYSPNDAPGQQAWIKQEPMDESQRGLDTGWSQSDSSNSGSNLYPVMMHQNSAAFTSSPIVPGFSTSGPSSSSRHGHSLPGTSGAANPYANPMPGTSQNTSGMDPSVMEDSWGMACRIGSFLTTASALAYDRSSLSTAALGVGGLTSKLSPAEKHRLNSRLYWRRLRQDPERRRLYNMRKAMEWRRRKERQQHLRHRRDLHFSAQDIRPSGNVNHSGVDYPDRHGVK